MEGGNPNEQQRTREACNPCRRKKTKCPGQKPSCSTCSRLRQTCTYAQSGSNERVQRLEGRIEELYDMIGTLNSQLSHNRSILRAPDQSIPIQQNIQATPEPFQHQQSSLGNFDPSERQEPDEESLKIILGVYQQYFDNQPLPLFDTDHLGWSKVRAWPRYLRWSLFAATVVFGNQPFFRGTQDTAIQFYLEAARNELTTHLWEPQSVTSVCRSLCLIAQTDIFLSNVTAAQTSINLAIAVAISNKCFSQTVSTLSAEEEDDRSRCCWSLLVLDQIYGGTLSLSTPIAAKGIPRYTQSVATPTTGAMTKASDIQPSENTQILAVEDRGITAYCLQLLSVWSDVTSFVRQAKEGQLQESWSNASKYHSINARLYEFETRLAQTHRYQKARFTKRSKEELTHHSKYWHQWLMMQFLLHAMQATLNHPFIHIADQRTRLQPPSFLQHTVDQATLHVGWILQLVDACEEQHFELRNPFIGHLVSVAATVFLFLLSSKNSDLASQADAGYSRCYDCIHKASTEWRHLQYTIEKLKLLHHGANATASRPGSIPPSKVQSSLLWELLEYSASTSVSNVPEMASDVVDLNVDTTFLSPVNPMGINRANPQRRASGQADREPPETDSSIQIWAQSSVEPCWDLFATEQMADFTQFSLDKNLWNFEQL